MVLSVRRSRNTIYTVRKKSTVVKVSRERIVLRNCELFLEDVS